MMKIVKFRFNMFGENCYVIYDPASRQAMVVDPGMINAAEQQALDSFIASNNLSVKYLVNTHLHLDHAFGNAHVAQTYGLTTRAHAADAPLGADLEMQARQFGIFNAPIANVDSIEPLAEGDTLSLGNNEIRVIHTPGHTPGGIALYAPADGWVITGDSLFANGGIGRTDLPGGNHAQLIDSLKNKLFTLPGETTVLPGHGPSSTIADETF